MRWLGLVFALGVAVAAPPAFAQTSDANARAAARKLGYAGIDAYQASDFKTAADKLDRAFRVLEAPSLGLWSARAFVKLGRFIDAQERYVEVTRLSVSAGEKAVQEKAKADAKLELDALAPRIPNLTVKLEGATAAEVALSIDGLAVKSELIGEAAPVDPGKHAVEGVRGSEKVNAEVTLAEGASESVLLRFTGPSPGAVPVAAAATTAAAAANPASPTAEPDTGAPQSASGGGSPLPVLGWIAIGVGGASLIAGGVTGAMTIEKKADLAAAGDCTGDGECKNTAAYRNFKTLRTASTVCFIAGGVLVGTGIILLVAAPKDSPNKVTLGIGPGDVTVSGSF